MSNILPKEKVKATRKNPKIIVIYSMPKVGKTDQLTRLADCLIRDTEGGSEMYDAVQIQIRNTDQYDAVDDEISALIDAQVTEGLKLGLKGPELKAYVKLPYRRQAVDTIDKLEDYCSDTATVNYKLSTIGKSFEGKSVIELPKGAGYYHLRNEVIDRLSRSARLCETLILSSHVRDKNLEKGGIQVEATDLSMTGKLGQMICAMADVIIYLYRDGSKLMANIGTNSTSIMGARAFPHIVPLLGKAFEFSWDKILID